MLNSSDIPGPHTTLHLSLHMCLRPSSPPPLGHPSTSMWPCFFICAFDHPHLRLWDTHPPQCGHVSSYVLSTILTSASGTPIHLNVAMSLHMCLRPSSPPPLGHPSTSMWPCLFICAFDHPHLRLWDTHPPQCGHGHLSRNCVVYFLRHID